MKFLITGDWHLRSNAPEHRIDDYAEVQRRKVRWLQHKATENDCVAILQPGDMTEHFPHSKVNFDTLQHYIKEFKLGPPIYTVYGQHDSSFRVDKTNTPLKVFMETGSVVLASSHGHFFPSTMGESHKYVTIYGAGYGEEIPKPYNSSDFNILLIHIMISDGDYWSGHVKYGTPEWLLNKAKDYKLIVSGDNHHSFTWFGEEEVGLINCGSLMRTNIDQLYHAPVAYVFDTDKFYVDPFYLPIDPPEEVFDMEEVTIERKRRDESVAFVERLEKGFDTEDINFLRNLNAAMVESEEGVNSIVQEALSND